jgi:gliding motility-associated-like protein
LTLGVLPVEGGILTANGIVVSPNPRTTTQSMNDAYSLSAAPNFGYKFIKYTTRHHALTPNKDVPDVTFDMNFTDTIIAIFEPIEKINLTVLVEPENSGEVEFNFLNVTNFPYNDSVYVNTTLSLAAKPYEEYSFSHWQMKHHVLLPDTLSERTTCNILERDTIIAHFVANENITPVVFIPLSFTPNGDGLNDLLFVAHSETVSAGSIKIFDRWGGLLYLNNTLNFKWDGTQNGRPLPQSVYYYEFNYTTITGESDIVRGTVTIVY